MIYKVKLQTFQNIDYESMQQYFAVMAEKGWIIQYAGAFLLFKKQAPMHLQFYVETFFDRRNELEYFDVCAKSGWNLQYHNKKIRIFVSDARDEMLPLQTDNELLWDQIQRHVIGQNNAYVFILAMITFYIIFYLSQVPWIYSAFLPLFLFIGSGWLWYILRLRRTHRYLHHCRTHMKEHERLYSSSYSAWRRWQKLGNILLYMNIIYFIFILLFLPYLSIALSSLFYTLLPILILGLIGIGLVRFFKLYKKTILLFLMSSCISLLAYLLTTSSLTPLSYPVTPIYVKEPLLQSIDTRYQPLTKDVMYTSSYHTPIHANLIYYDVLAPYGTSQTARKIEIIYDQKVNDEEAIKLILQLTKNRNDVTHAYAADGSFIFSTGQEEGKKWNMDEAFLQDHYVILRKENRVYQIKIDSDEKDAAYYISQLQILIKENIA